MSVGWSMFRPPMRSSRIWGPTHGIEAAMLVPTVTAQKASWSHGSR
jgi:hypothetical protein